MDSCFSALLLSHVPPKEIWSYKVLLYPFFSLLPVLTGKLRSNFITHNFLLNEIFFDEIALQSSPLQTTGGPRLVRFLGPGKNRTM